MSACASPRTGDLPGPGGVFTALDQYFDGAGRMAGFLPTGRGGVSLFWSVRLDRIPGGAPAASTPSAATLSLAPVAEALELRSMDQLMPGVLPVGSRCRRGTTGRWCCLATRRTR